MRDEEIGNKGDSKDCKRSGNVAGNSAFHPEEVGKAYNEENTRERTECFQNGLEPEEMKTGEVKEIERSGRESGNDKGGKTKERRKRGIV